MAARPQAWRSIGQAWPLVLVFGIIGVAVVYQVIAHPDQIGRDDGPRIADMPRDYGEDRYAAIAAAHEAVKTVLKDPDSARFSDEVVRDAKLPIVCGAVNARNGFGGYGGDSPFYVVGSMADVASPPGSDNRAFIRSWKLICEGKTAPKAAPHRHHPGRVRQPPATVAAATPASENLAPVTVKAVGGDNTDP